MEEEGQSKKEGKEEIRENEMSVDQKAETFDDFRKRILRELQDDYERSQERALEEEIEKPEWNTNTGLRQEFQGSSETIQELQVLGLGVEEEEEEEEITIPEKAFNDHIFELFEIETWTKQSEQIKFYKKFPQLTLKNRFGGLNLEFPSLAHFFFFGLIYCISLLRRSGCSISK